MTQAPTDGIPGELEARVDEIYSADLAAFIENRKALVAELKASGDKEAAATIQKLAKPNLIAWAINQLYFRERQAFDALVEAGEVVRLAQQSGDADDLRGAAEQRREALGKAVEQTAALLEQGGHSAPLQTLQRLERSLETVAAYGHSGLLEPAVGRLTGDLEAPGFSVLATLAMAPSGRPTAGSKKKSKKGARKDLADKKKRKGKAEASQRPKLSVVRGGGGTRSAPNETKSPPRSVDAGQLRERNRLLRRARQLETLVSKSETAAVRSQRSLSETERAFDLRRRNLEAAQKAFDESQAELQKRQDRLSELRDQHRELSASLTEVKQKLAELDSGVDG